jgi:endonuclease/exonuclease/phosphatase (EEP) superfamily protein YafD
MTVVTYNMGTFNGDLPDIEKVVNVLSSDAAPDVLLLQEVPSVQVAREIGDRIGLEHSLFSPYKVKGKYGLAILSRFPLSNPEILRQNGYASFAAQMDHDGEPTLLCSVHLARIRPIAMSKDAADISWRDFGRIVKSEVMAHNTRSRAVEHLLSWLASKNVKRVIIGGDFNTFPFSKAIREMSRNYDDSLWPSLYYFSVTYPKVDFLLKPRIDFIFHSSNVVCKSAQVIKESAGDHYPVVGVFEGG